MKNELIIFKSIPNSKPPLRDIKFDPPSVLFKVFDSRPLQNYYGKIAEQTFQEVFESIGVHGQDIEWSYEQDLPTVYQRGRVAFAENENGSISFNHYELIVDEHHYK